MASAGKHGLAGILISIVAVTACAPTVTLTPLNTGRTYSPTPDSVAIPLFATTRPDCAYDEIALITVEGNVNRPVEADVMSTLFAKARSVGAHAIVGYSQGKRQTAIVDNPVDIPVRSGTAVRFRSTDCMK